MKINPLFWTLFIFLISCTQKYTSYDLIGKIDFDPQNYQRPILPKPIYPSGKDELKSCFHQWFFSSNASTKTDQAIPYLVRSLCPGDDYLMDAQMTQTWWTTIVFTRSCVKVETKCASFNQNH